MFLDIDWSRLSIIGQSLIELRTPPKKYRTLLRPIKFTDLKLFKIQNLPDLPSHIGLHTLHNYHRSINITRTFLAIVCQFNYNQEIAIA